MGVARATRIHTRTASQFVRWNPLHGGIECADGSWTGVRVFALSSLQSLTLEELLETFEDLTDPDDRFDYIMDLGFELPDIPAALKTDENRVRGCQSRVWLDVDLKPGNPPTVEFIADSDGKIVKGLIAVLMTIFNGRTPRQILETDVEAIFTKLGLNQQLSSQRKNGLNALVQRIRGFAAANAEKGERGV